MKHLLDLLLCHTQIAKLAKKHAKTILDFPKSAFIHFYVLSGSHESSQTLNSVNKALIFQFPVCLLNRIWIDGEGLGKIADRRKPFFDRQYAGDDQFLELSTTCS